MAEDLRRLAAGLFMVGFPGTAPPPETVALVEQGLAGVIYFARNVTGASQLARMTADLVKRAPGPLLVAADEEGGIVSRLPRGLARMPGAMALGATGDPELARRVGRALASQLLAVGINVDLAPVLDLGAARSAIGVRSFAADPEAVAAFASAWITGLQDGGVLGVAKHFPGLGTTPVDSHLDRPVLPPPDRDVIPYRAAAAAQVAAVMVCHAAFPSIDPAGEPASRSRPLIEGLLRNELGFQGLVMTDCLEMKGATADVTVPEAAVLSLAAGADLALISHSTDLQTAAVDAVAEALGDGRLPLERARRARERIAAACGRFAVGAHGGPDPDAAPHLLDRPSDRALARQVAERALTALRPAALPAGARPGVVSAGVPLAEALAARGVAFAESVALPGRPAADAISRAAAIAAASNAVLVALGRTPCPDLLAALARTGRDLYVCCLSPAAAPDALAAGARAVWVGYDDSPATLEVAADALAGRLAGAGRLPVAL
jgi:beta-N-acetylhexosaminidase